MLKQTFVQLAIINWPNRVYAAFAARTDHANKTLGKLEEKNYKSHMKLFNVHTARQNLIQSSEIFAKNCTKSFQRK